MTVLLNVIAVLIFAIFLSKWILHYKYLESIGAYISYASSDGNSLIPKDAIRKYLLLFRSSIMLPIISSKGNKKTRRLINLLVLSFYLMIVGLFLVMAAQQEGN